MISFLITEKHFNKDKLYFKLSLDFGVWTLS
ncbi:hypothetical protein T11_7651, partial [Trichinella zimbabwensis]